MEENEIKKDELDISEKEEAEEEKPNRKIDFRFELALFLILGFLLGVVIKTEAVKRVTIGFNDGAIQSVKQGYDFEKIKKELEVQNSQAGQPTTEQPSSGQAAPDNAPQVNQ